MAELVGGEIQARRKRPRGVTILAVYMLLRVLLFTLADTGVIGTGEYTNRLTGEPVLFGDAAWLYVHAYVAIYAVAAIGLLLLKNWARITTLLLFAANIVWNFYRWIEIHSAPPPWVETCSPLPLVDWLVVFYLLEPSVVRAFRGEGNADPIAEQSLV